MDSEEEDLSEEIEEQKKELEESPDNVKPVVLEEVKVKKKPGRPKKQINKKVVPRLGIVKEPSNLNRVKDPKLVNIFELTYDNPLMFKKIFTLFKAMSAESIRMKLERDVIKMYAVDHSENNQIYVKIFGNRMNQYYLAENEDKIKNNGDNSREFGLGSNNILKIFQTLNKDISRVYWFTNKQYERSKIKIGLSNDEIEEDSIYSIDLNQVDEYDWSVEKELEAEENYPLKFELPFKYFKKKVSDFNLLGETMKIEKYGEGNLRLCYTFSNNKGDQNTSFRNPGKINLYSSIDVGEIFSTSVYLEHIKPLAGSLITEKIKIAACVDQPIIFTAYLDQDEKPNKDFMSNTERCIIKVLTKIVKAKKDAE